MTYEDRLLKIVCAVAPAVWQRYSGEMALDTIALEVLAVADAIDDEFVAKMKKKKGKSVEAKFDALRKELIESGMSEETINSLLRH